MHISRILLLAAALVGAALSPPGRAAGQAEADEGKVKDAGLPTDGPALVQFFKKRTLSDEDSDRVQKLVRQLGARAFRAREDAATELIARGPAVLDALRESQKNGDLEVV